MGFTDKLREALGAEGVRLSAAVANDQVAAGSILRAQVTATGGTKEARVDAYIVRLIQSTRRWTDQTGNPISESDALAEVDRSHLVATWDRRPVTEIRVDVNQDLAPSEAGDTPIEITVPTECQPSTLACNYTINVQADVKGQIDPTANAHVRIG